MTYREVVRKRNRTLLEIRGSHAYIVRIACHANSASISQGYFEEKAGEAMAPYSTEERDDGDEMDDIARRRAFRAVYSSAIEELRQADKCTECKTCVPKCPEMIAIPNEMLEIARVTYRFY